MIPRTLVASVLAVAGCAGAAVMAPVGPGVSVVARFTDARALATDGAGRLYVIDAGALVLLDTLGVRLPGGLHGTGLERLADAVDIDPTNGLEWFIADAAGGRVIRVSHDGRLLEDTPLPQGVPSGGVAPSTGASRGRPAAVAAGPGGVLFAVEASRSLVVRWDDSSRRRLRVIGAADAGRGTLADPVALAAAPDGWLVVADAGRGEAILFDAFGTFSRALPGPDGARSVAWTSRGDRPAVLVAGRRAVTTFSPAGDRLDGESYELGSEQLVDVLETETARWLLTPTRLLRAPRPEPAG